MQVVGATLRPDPGSAVGSGILGCGRPPAADFVRFKVM